MNNIKTILSALLTCLFLNSLQAQIAAQKGASLTDIYIRINELATKHDPASKAALGLEADALMKKDSEQLMNLGASLYEALQRKKDAEKAHKAVIKKFPRGNTVRMNEYNKIFVAKHNLPIAEVEKLYIKWLTKFPIDSFKKEERSIYAQADAQMATLFFREKNPSKGKEYIERLKTSPNYTVFVNGVGRDLINVKNNSTAIELLEPAYKIAKHATIASEDFENKIAIVRSYNNLAPTYARALLNVSKIDEATTVLEEYIKFSNNRSTYNVELLAQAYSQNNRDLDAFILLSDYLNNHISEERMINKVRELYSKLNRNQNQNIETYINTISAKSNQAVLAKYKKEMIKKEAPNFSLTNLKGETISLKDLRGKVVILDFWATWCGPCKNSFPGMQAAVNKYKGDKEVEFFFVDTWQKEENYKELVDQFIKENNYTFHVLFDEMKDRSNNTATAYGVRGIPHKVVIDKDGFIRFETAGGAADIDKIVNEMSAKIELAKKG
ncbi:TlpA disulfide reductase family protein [Sphingobacterium bovistauri]|uniref:TlpA family protein disulfide reductase n=1 Tax=Sphingobacterium bovistauri TaxID=2781959 RepID=A0ABS7Z984_9SPHI|nr:TlpA disulfide reductase family protein [Sphingobacterium bovistauri]MCA5006758.1 TlpA family protein disulfide reductase [Sphingobacterium bovistauri]